MAVRNSFTRVVPQCAAVFGLVTGSATTPTVTLLTGDLIADQAAVSVTRSSTGVYVVAITNFRGQRGSGTARLHAQATPTTTSNMVACTAATYSGDTASFTFSVEDDASTAQDNGFYFQVYAY